MICLCGHSIEKSHTKPDDNLVGMFCSECNSYCIVSPIFWRNGEPNDDEHPDTDPWKDDESPE